MGWYAVFVREMLILWKRIGRIGYFLSIFLAPFMYLFSFGLGLGSRIEVAGGYLPFLAAGIVGITVMMNSFQQASSSISVAKLYYKCFQSIVLSPVSAGGVMLGIVLAGMVRAGISAAMIVIAAWLVFGTNVITAVGAVGVVLGAFCFSAFGSIVGMLVRDPDDVPLVSNTVIMPMTFFGGSFFPLDNLPGWLHTLALFFPIGSINVLLRSTEWTGAAAKASLVLTALGLICLSISVCLYKRYSE